MAMTLAPAVTGTIPAGYYSKESFTELKRRSAHDALAVSPGRVAAERHRAGKTGLERRASTSG
jgi:hypothetical protein